MIDRFYSKPWALRRLRSGPLGDHIDAFARMLSEQGYAWIVAKEKIRLVSRFGQWLEERRIGLAELSEEKCREFLDWRGGCRRIRASDRQALKDLLNLLREAGVVPARAPEIDVNPVRQIESRFVRYLEQERGLQEVTIHNYLAEIRRFLSREVGVGAICLNELCLQDITRFILRCSRIFSLRRTQLAVCALRNFLRFLYRDGEISVDLAASVPRVANWRLSELPKFLESETIDRLLQSCDRSTRAGIRDFAILLLLSRLGLRAGEVVHMELGAIDWERGTIVVHGKSARCDELPIPRDVGEALSAYLRHGRPRCSSRRVFVRVPAPHRGFSTSASICDIIRRAFSRAGIPCRSAGAHLMRHSLATRMIRSGSSLPEIGEILRHQLPSTTEIYAKVDLPALRRLALPWPGGVS